MDNPTHPYVKLARDAIHHYSETGKTLTPPAEPGDPPPAGVFVSLHEPPRRGELEGPLRGCIGSSHPMESTLRREIARSAVAAAFSDPRFPPLTAGEIDGLHITVYLLGDLEPVRDLSELDPTRFGVMIEGASGRRGLLLPAIPGIGTVEQQIDIATAKAGFTPDDPVRIFRFAAEIIA